MSETLDKLRELQSCNFTAEDDTVLAASIAEIEQATDEINRAAIREGALHTEVERLKERIKNLERDALRLPPDLASAHALVERLNRDNKRQQTEIEGLRRAAEGVKDE